jgi:60 kDa SS-A/Ro ribonucleoprotein
MPNVFKQHVTPGQTPQTEQARPEQVKNNAGGYTFKVSDNVALNRFLTIGTEGGTFYVNEKKLTRDNAALVIRMAEASRPELIDEVIAVSEAGRAPRNTPALFALAAAAGLGNVHYRQRALDALPRVARTGYHLLVWAEYIEMFRGWGPQLVKGVRKWYTSKSPEDLAYQLLKYKQREGWSQRDLLRLCARKSATKNYEGGSAGHLALFEYVMKGDYTTGGVLPKLIDVAEQAHDTDRVSDWVRLIQGNRSLSWEMLPSGALASPAVWEALVAGGNLPMGALLRNLSRLTRLGVLAPMSSGNALVLAKLRDQEQITKARIHPIAVLLALKTYALGHSIKGKSSWTPIPQVIDALNEMFYLAFGNVVPSGKRTVLAMDISGSMGFPIADYPFTAREIAAAMSMIVARTEPQYQFMGFSHQFIPLPISASQRLDDVVRTVSNLPFGGTDCSLPMLWAQQNQLAVDTFQVFTDNETWAGRMHPHEALAQYRKFSGIDARLQVVAVTPTDFSIADPKDAGTLDVSGFDSAVPSLLADHARGDI